MNFPSKSTHSSVCVCVYAGVFLALSCTGRGPYWSGLMFPWDQSLSHVGLFLHYHFLWQGRWCRWLEARVIPITSPDLASRSGLTNGTMHIISDGLRLPHPYPSSLSEATGEQGKKTPHNFGMIKALSRCETIVTPQHIYAWKPSTFWLILHQPGLAVCGTALTWPVLTRFTFSPPTMEFGQHSAQPKPAGAPANLSSPSTSQVA